MFSNKDFRQEERYRRSRKWNIPVSLNPQKLEKNRNIFPTEINWVHSSESQNRLLKGKRGKLFAKNKYLLSRFIAYKFGNVVKWNHRVLLCQKSRILKPSSWKILWVNQKNKKWKNGGKIFDQFLYWIDLWWESFFHNSKW